MENSNIAEYFSGKSVLITGGTGFIGMVLIEKLLSSCENIKAIYVLIRLQKGLTMEQRLAAITDCEIFDSLKRRNVESLKKIIGVCGDISLDQLSLTSSDYETISQNVSVIFHCAASVQFAKPLTTAIKNHVIGTRNVLQLAKDCCNLEVLTYVSTAYSNCNQPEILEVIYKTPIKASELLELLDTNEDDFNKIASSMMKDIPNTYLFCKIVTENLLQEEKGEIPIAIVRPSIVLGLARGVNKGWIQGMTLFPVAVMAHAKGLLFNINSDPNNTADLVPVDYVINAIIAAAWYTLNNRNDEVLVYNTVSGPTNPIIWKQFADYCYEAILTYPPKDLAWYPHKKFDFSKSNAKWSFKLLFDEKLSAAFMDLILFLTGQKPRYLKYVKKFELGLKSADFAISNRSKFGNSKTRELFQSLSPVDQDIFYFDVSDIDWDSYIKAFYLGVRKNFLRDDMTTVEKAKQNLHRLYWIRHFTRAVGFTFLFFIVARTFFNSWF